MLQTNLNELKRHLSEYAALVERMLGNGLTGLLERDRTLLSAVCGGDAHGAGTLRDGLDDQSTSLIARYEPKAKDLRTVLMVLKTAYDLDQIAENIVAFTRSGLILAAGPQSAYLGRIGRMGDVVRGMLKDALTSFVVEDTRLARRVFDRDVRVDAMRDLLLEELTDHMGDDRSDIRAGVYLLRIANNMERIGDLTKNICEDVVFLVEGRMVKHRELALENV